ncbi:uncharacterized protein KY384_008783 [Bacidia gigantensis]|uniref:uncharacterized protein n=1 Tax=Bacidia gigantensis TaxID=2732470 RepID=UPI001D04BC16|nr:uncharacterized protein KY384_008783 [Bacidia gigantensis]KAG8526582.1 hypothetical protein KY384_008783 [Bacidia gigantensis]
MYLVYGAMIVVIADNEKKAIHIRSETNTASPKKDHNEKARNQGPALQGISVRSISSARVRDSTDPSVGAIIEARLAEEFKTQMLLFHSIAQARLSADLIYQGIQQLLRLEPQNPTPPKSAAGDKIAQKTKAMRVVGSWALKRYHSPGVTTNISQENKSVSQLDLPFRVGRASNSDDHEMEM